MRILTTCLRASLTILVGGVSLLQAKAQSKADDFGRAVLNAFVPENSALSEEAKRLLQVKLSQIAVSNGVAGTELNPRFVLTAQATITTKDILPGPPQMVAQNLALTLFVADALDHKLFGSTTLNLKGVGLNENKAFINAFANLSPNNKIISTFIGDAKARIDAYYSSQCGRIIKDAEALVSLGKFSEAIYSLSVVPASCQDCYPKALSATADAYQSKVDADCATQLNRARTAWAAEQNSRGAEQAKELLYDVSPQANCQPEALSFMKVIEGRLQANEREQWQFKMKAYADRLALQKEQLRLSEKNSAQAYALDKVRIQAYRDVAVKYAENQPRVINYNTIELR